MAELYDALTSKELGTSDGDVYVASLGQWMSPEEAENYEAEMLDLLAQRSDFGSDLGDD